MGLVILSLLIRELKLVGPFTLGRKKKKHALATGQLPKRGDGGVEPCMPSFSSQTQQHESLSTSPKKKNKESTKVMLVEILPNERAQVCRSISLPPQW